MSLRKEVPKDVLRTVQQASTKRKIYWLVRVKADLIVGGIGCGGGVAGGVLGVFTDGNIKLLRRYVHSRIGTLARSPRTRPLFAN
jgi:hypothetical protein